MSANAPQLGVKKGSSNVGAKSRMTVAFGTQKHWKTSDNDFRSKPRPSGVEIILLLGKKRFLFLSLSAFHFTQKKNPSNTPAQVSKYSMPQNSCPGTLSSSAC